MALMLVGLAAGAGSVRAQETTARVTGQVTDAAGAVVSNAEITLTNRATREERKVQTDEDGNYVLTQVQPGAYDLSIRGQSFKEYVNQNFDLNVNDRSQRTSKERSEVNPLIKLLAKA